MDRGVRGVAMFLEEIRRHVCIDTGVRLLALLLLCLAPEDVSRLRFGTVSPCNIESPWSIRIFFSMRVTAQRFG